MRQFRFAIAASVIILAGCGQAGQQGVKDMQEGAQKAAQGAQQAQQAGTQEGQAQGQQSLAQGLAQMAQGFKTAAQTGPDGKPITSVDFEKLLPFLPSAAGWERDKPEGHQVTSPVAVSTADVRYTKGNAHAHVTITDSAFSPVFMMPFTMLMSMNYGERSTSGYKKSVAYSSQPGLEEWNSDNKHGEVTVIANKRFVVQATGDGLESMDDLKAIVNAIDLARLGALQ